MSTAVTAIRHIRAALPAIGGVVGRNRVVEAAGVAFRADRGPVLHGHAGPLERLTHPGWRNSGTTSVSPTMWSLNSSSSSAGTHSSRMVSPPTWRTGYRAGNLTPPGTGSRNPHRRHVPVPGDPDRVVLVHHGKKIGWPGSRAGQRRHPEARTSSTLVRAGRTSGRRGPAGAAHAAPAGRSDGETRTVPAGAHPHVGARTPGLSRAAIVAGCRAGWIERPWFWARCCSWARVYSPVGRSSTRWSPRCRARIRCCAGRRRRSPRRTASW